MANPSTITHWLAQPEMFSPADRQELVVVLQRYPYFVPARYLQAAEQQKKASFAPAMMEQMQLYKGNWMLFHQFLKKISVDTAPERGGEHSEADTSLLDAKSDLSEITAQKANLTEGDDLIVDEEEFSFEFDEASLEKLYETSEQKAGAMFDSSPPEMGQNELVTDQKNEEASTGVEETVEVKPVEIPKPHQAYLPPQKKNEEGLIQPIYTEDYFLHQGIQVSEEISLEETGEREDKSLMVVMSFSEWLMHFKSKSEREKEEQKDQKALRTMWQKEKLAAAMEEENEEIPEDVFEMAVNSITREDDLVSESLAEILLKQQKHDKAIDMYKKLSLRNPQKNAYFARKIEEILKEIES